MIFENQKRLECRFMTLILSNFSSVDPNKRASLCQQHRNHEHEFPEASSTLHGCGTQPENQQKPNGNNEQV
jgi:hypothetical protein